MAEHHGTHTPLPVGAEFREHERTYAGFLALFKYGTIAVIAILIVMAYFLL